MITIQTNAAYLLQRRKTKQPRCFCTFLAILKDAIIAEFKSFNTDGGGEYANIDLFCKSTGIARQRTEADNPASNGKAERNHRTVLNMSRCMIFYC